MTSILVFSDGELIGDGIKLNVDAKIELKKHPTYKVMGKSIPRVDIPGKVTGEFTYIHDVRVPGMVHGRMIRPPVAGASIARIDEASVKDIPNVRVVRDKDMLGVVADTEWDAIRAARQLKVTWSDVKAPFPEQKDIYNHIRAGKSMKRDEDVKANGDVDSAGVASGADGASVWVRFKSGVLGAVPLGKPDNRSGRSVDSGRKRL